MNIGEVQSEAYTRLTLDGLKDINYRLEAAKLSLKEENESLLSYVFPLLRYHSRITDLNRDDFNYFFRRDLISHHGYLMQTAVDPQTEEPFQQPLFDYSFPDVCWEYLCSVDVTAVQVPHRFATVGQVESLIIKNGFHALLAILHVDVKGFCAERLRENHGLNHVLTLTDFLQSVVQIHQQ